MEGQQCREEVFVQIRVYSMCHIFVTQLRQVTCIPFRHCNACPCRYRIKYGQ